MKATVLTFLALAACGALASAQTLKLYYGLLHAHTAFSDGSGTPEEAYAMAKGEGLDFFAVTPHNHSAAENLAKERKDGLLVANDHRLYNATGQLTVAQKFKNGKTKVLRAKSVIGAASAATDSKFLALYGQEFSTISAGNHMNVFGVDDVLVNEAGNFRSFFETLAGIKASGKPAPLVQLNHPDVRDDLFNNGTHKFNDYGIDDSDLGPHFRDWVRQVDEYVALIEILSGPALKDVRHTSYHYKDHHENDYYFYLCQGLHVSPSVGQDNHYKNWGLATPARTGLYARSLKPADIDDAVRSNRTFATEDKNLALRFWVNGRLMGDRMTVQPDAELNMKVAVTDGDEPASGYRILLVSGLVNPELSTAATDLLPRNGILDTMELDVEGEYTFDPLIAAEKETFFYVVVQQTDGDRAWSAPVWVSAAPLSERVPALPPGKYAWTKNSSRYYHLSGCPSVKLISPENLRSGDVPPPQRRLHDCRAGE